MYVECEPSRVLVKGFKVELDTNWQDNHEEIDGRVRYEKIRTSYLRMVCTR